MSKNGRHLSLSKVIISLFMTIPLWTIVTNAWGYTEIFFHAKSGSWTNYIYDFISRFVWSVPAIVLLSVYEDEVLVTWKQLFTNKPDWKVLGIFITVIVVYNICGMFSNHGGLWINPDFDLMKHLMMFIMVGFAEEIVYRGWGLNALSSFMNERRANIVSTVFFIILHLPAYFIKFFLNGTFPVSVVVTQCVMVLILGLAFGYLYRKGKCIWACMLVHFLSDFLSVLLIG